MPPKISPNAPPSSALRASNRAPRSSSSIRTWRPSAAGSLASLRAAPPDRKDRIMREHKIAAIPGDGIGKEVIAAGLEVLRALVTRDGGFRLAVEELPWGSEYYLQHGHYIPDGGLARLRAFDAIFFGAVGDQRVPDHVSLWGLRLPIVQGFDQYANVRPARVLPGVESPLRRGQAIGWVIQALDDREPQA